MKLGILTRLCKLLGRDGNLVFYKGASPDGEDRAEWLGARWDRQEAEWKAYTPAEWQAARSHVRACDYPEARSNWIALGNLAGFEDVREVIVWPTGLFRILAMSS